MEVYTKHIMVGMVGSEVENQTDVVFTEDIEKFGRRFDLHLSIPPRTLGMLEMWSMTMKFEGIRRSPGEGHQFLLIEDRPGESTKERFCLFLVRKHLNDNNPTEEVEEGKSSDGL